jgi:hypothetical protein
MQTPHANSIAQVTKTPWQDPILLELHATREKLAYEYGNDIKAICDAARQGLLRNISFNNEIHKSKQL